MKINNIKTLVVIALMLMLSGIILGLFFVAIPEENEKVAYMLIGMIGTALIQAITDLFKRGVANG